MLCGDEEGNVWLYDVRPLLSQQAPLPAAPQAPTQVGALPAPPPAAGAAEQEAGAPPPSFAPQILKWPQPWALGQMVTKTMVNTVAANRTCTYLTALTDSNIVAIWKRQ